MNKLHLQNTELQSPSEKSYGDFILLKNGKLKTVNEQGNEVGIATDDSKDSWYGTCATTAATTAKVVVCSDFILTIGVHVAVTFTYANTAASPTVNVNGTGAYTLTRLSNWEAGATVILVWTGSVWLMVETAAQKSFYGTCATVAATTAKVGTVAGFTRTTGSRVSLKFTYDNTAASPTLNVNTTGAAAIYDYRTNTYPVAGSMVAGGTYDFLFNGSQWILLNPCIFQYSTTDLTAGSSALGTGAIYLVYE